jgi:ribosome biogenesis GTP-binding protein YsxC/EngB
MIRTKFVTGHKKTTKKNVKKRKAILRKKKKGEDRGSQETSKQPQTSKRIQKIINNQKRIDKDPDYPIPRSYYENKEAQSPEEEEEEAEAAASDEEAVSTELSSDSTPATATSTSASSAATKTNKAPPAVITRTGSPFVYVAKIACREHDGTPINPHDIYNDNFDAWFEHFHRLGKFQPFPFPAKGKFPSGSDGADGIPVVAVLGRSNVGKSSLINAIARHKGLAMTSKAPGRTQRPYFYGWVPHNKKRCKVALPPIGFLVDLAGYGFARKAPDFAVGSWQQETQRFLITCTTLKRLYLLQDSRLRTPQQLDEFVMKWIDDQKLHATIPYTVILTKADDEADSATAGVVRHANLVGMRYQLQRMEEIGTAANVVQQGEEEIDDSSPLMSPYIHVTSARRNLGVPEVLASMYTEWKSSDAQLFEEEEEYEYEEEEVEEEEE